MKSSESTTNKMKTQSDGPYIRMSVLHVTVNYSLILLAITLVSIWYMHS